MCWVIGRYSEWIASTVAHQLSEPSSPPYVTTVFSVLLAASVDDNPRIQTSALAAVIRLIESVSALESDEQEFVLKPSLIEAILKYVA